MTVCTIDVSPLRRSQTGQHGIQRVQHLLSAYLLHKLIRDPVPRDVIQRCVPPRAVLYVLLPEHERVLPLDLGHVAVGDGAVGEVAADDEHLVAPEDVAGGPAAAAGEGGPLGEGVDLEV